MSKTKKSTNTSKKSLTLKTVRGGGRNRRNREKQSQSQVIGNNRSVKGQSNLQTRNTNPFNKGGVSRHNPLFGKNNESLRGFGNNNEPDQDLQIVSLEPTNNSNNNIEPFVNVTSRNNNKSDGKKVIKIEDLNLFELIDKYDDLKKKTQTKIILMILMIL